MISKSFVVLAMGVTIFLFASFSSADVPHMINYQGKLTSASGGCVDDTLQMTFTIYSDSLGVSDEWTETQTEVVVKDGIFNVLLGSVDTIPAAVFDGNVKYLGVQVESDPEMTPLKPMVSVAYAYRAHIADGVGGWVDDGSVVRLADSLDQVAIGTSSPRTGCKLHLQDYPYVYVLLDHGQDTTWSVGTGAGQFAIGMQTESWAIARLYIMSNGDTWLCPATGKVWAGGPSSAGSPAKLEVTGDNNQHAGTMALTNAYHPVEAGVLLGQVLFWGADGNGQAGAEIRSTAAGEWAPGSAAANLQFMTTPSGASVPTERMTITEDGDVGIGRTDPNYLLHIQSSDDPEFGITRSGVNTFLLNVTGAVGQTDYLNVSEHGGDTVVIASFGDNGRVGIGTTSPEAKLHLVDDTDVNAVVGLAISNPGGEWSIKSRGDFMGDAFNSLAFKEESIGRYVLVMQPNGNVGIGTTSPQGALDVNSTTGAFIAPRMTTAQRNALSAVNGMIIYNTTTNQFNFYENGAWVTK